MIALNDENVLRSVASTYGGLNSDAYATTIQDYDDREALKSDLVDQIYNEVVVPQYVPERKQTVGTTRSGGGSMTAAERQTARIQANFNKMGNITKSNYESFLNQVPNFQGKYRAKVKDNTLLIADAKSSKVISKIDLSNPTLAKSTLANLAGVSGYRGQNYDAKSLIAQYSN